MANPEEFKVSVIIPFFNAREYVERAVDSALSQPETGEVILINDDSPDGGLDLCKVLASKNKKILLLEHPDKKNHGPGASRNLGIRTARFPYIAFLDADDYFLPNRFVKTAEVFAVNPDVAGVYEAIGATFENEQVQDFFLSMNFHEFTTVSEEIHPDELFEKLMSGRFGYFSFDGFTGRKNELIKEGLFREDLYYMEDTDFMLRLSAQARLLPGSLSTPVTIRRVHGNNRVTIHASRKREIYSTSLIMWEVFSQWGKIRLSTQRESLVLMRLLDRYRKSDYFDDFQWGDFLTARRKMFRLAREFPLLLAKVKFWRYLVPSINCFKTNRHKHNESFQIH